MDNKLCSECNTNQANIHFAQIAQNEVSVLHLCEECAKKKGISIVIEPQGSATAALNVQQPDTREKKDIPDIQCPACRMTLREFKEKGWLGCAACYSAFDKDIEGLLIQVHGSSVHKGKVYKKLESFTAGEIISNLKKELQDAIRNEKFEAAALIRDKINTISSLKADGTIHN